MGAANDILKNINLFVDGQGHAGEVEEVTPPPLTLVTEDFRAGGMDAPVKLDMGMEAMEASFSMASYNAALLSQFGVSEGNSVQCTLRGAIESFDGTVKPITINLRGKITSVDEGTWAPGQKPQIQYTMNCIYYKRQVDGRLIHEIDIENMKRIVDGVDRLEEIRAAIGV